VYSIYAAGVLPSLALSVVCDSPNVITPHWPLGSGLPEVHLWVPPWYSGQSRLWARGSGWMEQCSRSSVAGDVE
jgi:hypothetical protein